MSRIGRATLAMILAAGPVPDARLSEAYLRHLARDVTFWAWPMVEVYSLRAAGTAGVLPAPDVVACGESLALDKEPVIVKVPDFGDRFWVVLAADLRTDAFANLGSMYGTRPGSYMLVGPKWNGEAPPGVVRIFHARTSTGFLVARAFTDGTPDDRKSALTLLLHFDGRMRALDAVLPPFEPAAFFETLPLALADAPPLPGEETRYGEAKALLLAMKQDATIKAAALEEAARAEKELIAPLFEFGSFGVPLPDRWTTLRDGADFGTDYAARTALFRADPFVNRPGEAMTWYLDRDRDGARLSGAHRYTVSFAKGALPPVRAGWSLALYDARHALVASVGTASPGLAPSANGSLPIVVQAEKPGTASGQANWLKAPAGADFSLVLRAWWPESGITSGRFTPPAAIKVR